MAFTIKNISGASMDLIVKNLTQIFDQSRFVARIETRSNKITIHDVRLKEKKDYCGNHPFACPVRGFERPHKKYKYLEGADWVAFND